MQSWSNISVNSQGKINMIETTLNKYKHKNLYEQFIEDLVEDVQNSNCFNPILPHKKKEKISKRETLNEA